MGVLVKSEISDAFRPVLDAEPVRKVGNMQGARNHPCAQGSMQGIGQRG